MADYVETSSRSWFSRLGGAIKGILVGFVLVIVGAVLLFWNEGRAVKRAKTLDEGAGAVVSVDAGSIDPARDGRLVHMTGEAVTDGELADPMFGVREAGAIRLEREVEMFQWVEHEERKEEKKVGGGTQTTTTYSYRTEWSDDQIDSSGFKVADGHANPGFPFHAESWQAERVTLGAFTLGDSLRSGLTQSEEVPVDASHLAALTPELQQEMRAADGRFYRGADPAAPQVGDVRVSFSVVRPAVVSVVARQAPGGLLEPYQAQAGGTISLLEYGPQAAETMFQAAQAANTTLTWILRLVGFVLVLIGFSSVLKPLSVLADVIPFLGNLVGGGTFLVSLVLAALVSTVTVAVGWIVYRPLLGGALLAVAVGFSVWLWKRSRKPAAASQPLPAMPPPPPPMPAG